MSDTRPDLPDALSAARAGSREALGLALESCRLYLLEIARQEMADDLKAKSGASDLVQETFLEAHRSFESFAGESAGELRAWLRQLLLHHAAKLGRRYHTTKKRSTSRETEVDGDRDAARTPTPSVQVMGVEQWQRLQSALARLPDDYRRVIQWRYQDGLSFEEIGGRLGKTANAARLLWLRAVERLKLDMGP